MCFIVVGSYEKYLESCWSRFEIETCFEKAKIKPCVRSFRVEKDFKSGVQEKIKAKIPIGNSLIWWSQFSAANVIVSLVANKRVNYFDGDIRCFELQNR
jgi:hypothetical protein